MPGTDFLLQHIGYTGDGELFDLLRPDHNGSWIRRPETSRLSETQVRAALAGQCTEAEIRGLIERARQHFRRMHDARPVAYSANS